MKEEDFEDFDAAPATFLHPPLADRQLGNAAEDSESDAANVAFLSSTSRTFVFDSPLDLNDPGMDRGGSHFSEAPQSPSPQSPPSRIVRMSEVKIPR